MGTRVTMATNLRPGDVIARIGKVTKPIERVDGKLIVTTTSGKRTWSRETPVTVVRPD